MQSSNLRLYVRLYLIFRNNVKPSWLIFTSPMFQTIVTDSPILLYFVVSNTYLLFSLSSANTIVFLYHIIQLIIFRSYLQAS